MKKDFDPERFAKNLKKLIELNKVKHIDLAEDLGVVKSAISNYVSGKHSIGLETAAKIASYFDVSVDYLIGYKHETFHEGGKPACEIPVFHKSLSLDTVIYRSDNYIGVISSPLPIGPDVDSYAVKIYDDSMKSFGLLSESMVFFSPEVEVKTDDIAAVLIKSKKQIFIRSVKLNKNKITLISDNKSEEFKITRNDSDVQILGKVVYPILNQNKKSTD